MEEWRLILDPPGRGAHNMAVDLALLNSLARRSGPPVLRLYSWSPPAITIGYFQRMEEEVRVDECRAMGVEVIRRVTGGGAVFHDNEITYSVFIPLSHRLAASSIRESYGLLCAPIVDCLRGLGLEARFSPVNDVLVGGAKVSGSAQTRRNGVLLQHGTLLIGVDAASMFRVLNVAKEKSAATASGAPEHRVTSLEALLGDRARGENFAGDLGRRLALAFAGRLGCDFVESGLSVEEKRDALRIEEELFRKEEWNRDRSIRPVLGNSPD